MVISARVEAGDHLEQATFHGRYKAVPSEFRAELIGRRSSTRVWQHRNMRLLSSSCRSDSIPHEARHVMYAWGGKG
jgi:hypothetical protein